MGDILPVIMSPAQGDILGGREVLISGFYFETVY
jgi:hypothetical protein